MLSQGIGANGIGEQTLSVVLRKELGSPVAPLQLDFYGVRKLVLRQPEWSLLSIAHIEIAIAGDLPSVADRVLVRDPDQDEIVAFECRDFDAHLWQ